MFISKKKTLLIVLSVTLMLPVSAICASQLTDSSIVMTNPLNLSYLFEEKDPVHRTAADPVIVLYHDRYFLFSSHAAGYSYSDNLRDWTHMFSKMPLVKEWAPAVMVYDDYIYYMGFGNKRVFRTKDPVADAWEEVTWTELTDKGDPDFFVDNNGRTYYLWGCSSGGAMQGQEFDPNTFKPLTAVTDLMPADGSRLGWEVPGDNNELVNSTGWNEGVSMVHDGAYYYFFYATPGTEYAMYCTGAYVGRSPLGPFSVMRGAPFAIKPAGFITGGGHGHPFTDRYGNHWYVASLIIGAREHYERRIGIFPAFYRNGYAHAITDNFDHPFVVPDRKMDFEKESILLNMNLLSPGKSMIASSSLRDMLPQHAADDNIKNWWAAASSRKGEWLQMDLGSVMSVEAVQACFADEGFKSYRYDKNIPIYRYVIEGSVDGENWQMLADRSDNKLDQIYELIMLPEPYRVRYLRITNQTRFIVGQFSLSEFRVFGHADIPVPAAVEGLRIVRGKDARRMAISWQPVQGAEGYIVRWGPSRNHVDHAARVYTDSVEYGFFDKTATYYVTVQAFNEAGLGAETDVLTVSPTGYVDVQRVETVENKNTEYFSLSGISTRPFRRGIYIKGGRKVLKMVLSKP